MLSTFVQEQHRSIYIMHLGRFVKRMLSKNKNKQTKNSNNKNQNQNSDSEFMGVAS